MYLYQAISAIAVDEASLEVTASLGRVLLNIGLLNNYTCQGKLPRL